MPLSWNEIKSRAITFTNKWKDEESEDAEAKSFWDEFFYVFGIRRRRTASFEYHVKQLNNKAHGQVLDYLHGIEDKQLPRYILETQTAAKQNRLILLLLASRNTIIFLSADKI